MDGACAFLKISHDQNAQTTGSCVHDSLFNFGFGYPRRNPMLDWLHDSPCNCRGVLDFCAFNHDGFLSFGANETQYLAKLPRHRASAFLLGKHAQGDAAIFHRE